ncbi:hypothetical protein [Modestobacter versicolor]|uniref:Outer membrane murein-binding lipoprotein Lpp n=1 Tax=Modestobacter versicolor TaxID=429133 RepID=A0A323V3G4_9ACTN|nr:hypothetical protein [Modestobacter versicolor]MBB3678379.1 outer membrane murein-binding lipoprotein Lpp [Modestobacter versicolor]PZA19347.1 hypothetical protein DMO24_21235 [Modestobacter versicolor]
MSDPSSASLAELASSRPFTRRSLLVAALAGTALTAVGCTQDDGGDAADAVTPAQVDQLAAQVRVQESLVAAYATAFAAAPELAATATTLADQARAQLDRLRAAAPGSAAPSSTGASAPAAVVDAAGARGWLRSQVSAAADAHATACPDFTGGRAALLGSIAAGLRGQDGQLA